MKLLLQRSGVAAFLSALTLANPFGQVASTSPVPSINVTGLSSYGVLLSGDPQKPTITNTTSRRIIAYSIIFQDAAGHHLNASTYSFLSIRNKGLENAGIAPGAQKLHEFSSAPVVHPAGSAFGPFVRATLDSVLFDDGEVVGPDTLGFFRQATTRIAAARDLYGPLLAAQNGSPSQRDTAWSAVILASEGTFSQTTPADIFYRRFQSTLAAELVRVKNQRGEGAAFQLAAKAAAFPTIWRKR